MNHNHHHELYGSLYPSFYSSSHPLLSIFIGKMIKLFHNCSISSSFYPIISFLIAYVNVSSSLEGFNFVINLWFFIWPIFILEASFLFLVELPFITILLHKLNFQVLLNSPLSYSIDHQSSWASIELYNSSIFMIFKSLNYWISTTMKLNIKVRDLIALSTICWLVIISPHVFIWFTTTINL